MKTKKINFDWKSVLLGAVLCMVLVVFVGGKASAQQNYNPDGSVVKTITPTDLLAKSYEIQKQIIAMEKTMIRIEQKIDEQGKDLTRAVRILDKIRDKEIKN